MFKQTGMTIDAFNRLHKRPAPKYKALKIAVCPAERQTLYDRIDRRVDQMLADGLLAETQRLLDSGMLTGTAAQAIGYKELLGYLQGSQPLQGCVALLKQRSRNYATVSYTHLGLLSYLEQTQQASLAALNHLQVYHQGQYMELDLIARRNLELCETMRTKEKKGTLLWVLDHTRTAMGSRLIRQWLEKPLYNPLHIARRQQAVGALCDDVITRTARCV